MDSSTPTLDLRSYREEVCAHQHDYHQLVLPVTGQLLMHVGTREGRVLPRQLAVISAGTAHDFAAPEDNCFVVAGVPAPLAPELERLPAFIQMDAALAQYVAFLHRELSRGAHRPNSANSERQMLLLLIELLKERSGHAPPLDRRVDAARAYLDSHYHRPVSLRQLSAVAHLSPRRLSELFRRQLGKTPHDYLTEKRMQEARSLLEAGSLAVSLVAQRVGFASLSAFSDRFRRHFGRPPSYYRRIDK